MMRAVAIGDYHPTRFGHDPHPALGLYRGPRCVTVRRKRHIFIVVIIQPNNARVILRRAAGVKKLKLLKPQYRFASAARQPIKRGAADAATTNDDIFKITFHETDIV